MPHLGRCCQCSAKKAVTLKRFSGTDGSTDWEYGPGLLWSHKYAGSYITGLVPDLSPSINRYVITTTAGATTSFPDRSATTLSANCFEGFTITEIDTADGSVNASATLEGVFASGVTGESISLLYPSTLSRSACLSGGDLVLLGERPPQIELDDYATNPTTKEYTFHAHTQAAGDVVFTTRTSGDTITIPYSCTAANCKTQIETSGDVSSATVTGGPWPHSKLNVSVTWNGTSDDFDDVTPDGTYTVSGVSRTTNGAATAYSPSTGLITSSAPYIFGLSSGGASWLISQTPLVPSTLDPATRTFVDMVAGPSNSLAVYSTDGYVQSVTASGTWSINWTKNDNLGVNLEYAHIENGSLCLPASITDFANPSKTRNGALIAMSTGTVTEIDDGLPSSLRRSNGGDHFWISEEGSATTRHIVGQRAGFSDADYNVEFQYWPDGVEVTTDAGDDFLTGFNWNPRVSHADSTSLLGLHSATDPIINIDPPPRNPSNHAGSVSKAISMTFYCANGPYDNATQFRFRFVGGSQPVKYSDWIAWNATEATIEAAILTAFPENTEGVVSNVEANPFGTPAAIDNTTGLLDRGLQLLFAGGTVSQVSTWGFILLAYLKIGRVTVETQSTDDRYGGQIILIDHSDASETWSRDWGDKGAISIGPPLAQWIYSGNVYAFGSIVDNDLP